MKITKRFDREKGQQKKCAMRPTGGTVRVKGSFTQKCKVFHNFLTLMLFQTSMTFFCKNIFWEISCMFFVFWVLFFCPYKGSHWLPTFFKISYFVVQLFSFKTTWINSIQVYLYSAFYDTIVAKQLYTKLCFHNTFIYCRNLKYWTYGKICLIQCIVWGVGIISSQVFGHLR